MKMPSQTDVFLVNVTEYHNKCAFSTIASSEKFRYLKNGTIFLQVACVEIHLTLAPMIYVKTSQIGGHRLSTVGPN